ncbi:hypothetical protein [Mucilaginibacter lappiensis]|uniref:Lipopolysaccharide export LptBFGC system permease protein LptF n=1 Tax=Mucilaginibacter lappiensis TaxID=354630 RepID=A0A841JNA0_9SPHI|nr:hypothetical protein [Mucilaginibacter lappiensis]MBB6130198.1 lipopolysaccharide export LptBFGC system permease protein LptF [Mucilaginibacter lappiensis]
MKHKALLIPAVGLMLLVFACNRASEHQVNKKLVGKWQSKDGETKLEISDKGFTMDDGKPVTEDYFVTNDTIFTSYQGSRPFTKFLIKNLDDHKLTLFYPDSDVVEFSR